MMTTIKCFEKKIEKLTALLIVGGIDVCSFVPKLVSSMNRKNHSLYV